MPNMLGWSVSRMTVGYLMLIVLTTGMGIMAAEQNGCGDVFTSEDREFTTPNYPYPYDPSKTCTWTITVEPDTFIQLTFSDDFQLENPDPTNKCVYDNVTIYDVSDDGTLNERGTWCGENGPPTLNSSSSSMKIKFRSDHSAVRRGFKASWKQMEKPFCVALYEEDEGHIMFPQDNSKYPNAAFCRWEIRVETGYAIKLSFTKFKLENQNNRDECAYDWLQITETASQRPERINETMCGTKAQIVKTTSGSIVDLVFRSDETNTFGGFKLTWNKVVRDDWQNTLEAPVDKQLVLDVSTPYPTHMHYRWRVKAKDNGFVMVKMTTSFQGDDYNLSCENGRDRIEVFDVLGNGTFERRGQWCGTSNSEVAVKSYGLEMVVMLHTDHDDTNDGQGFHATVTSVSECDQDVSSMEGYLMSYNYPETSGTNCKWTISIPDGFIIQLHLVHASDYSHIKVFNYAGGVESAMNASDKDPLTSFRNNMTIEFDGTGSDDHFLFATWNSKCGGSFFTNDGTLSSLNYPDKYGNNMDCRWDVNVDKNRFITLKFEQDFDVEAGGSECLHDYVEVFDVDGDACYPKGKFCSSNPPPVLISNSSRMEINFHSDGSKTGKGFSVSWNTDCGGILTGTNGKLSTPNYGNGDYPPNLDCDWTIEGIKGHNVHLRFDTSFQLEAKTKTGCEADYVKISDGTNEIETYCGDTINPLITSNSQSMMVTFHSDNDKHGLGFSATWDTECGEVHTSEEGNITSLADAEGFYPTDLNCSWTIQVKEGMIIRLTLHIESIVGYDTDCHGDYVEVLDVPNDGRMTQNSLGRWCDDHRPDEHFTSTSNNMRVFFHSDGTKVGKGFRAQWKSVCGAHYTNSSGTIVSPGYGDKNEYPPDMDCEWEIKADQGHFVHLVFNPPFELDSDSHQCTKDYIEIIDPEKTPIDSRRYCQNRLPPNITSSSSRMIIRFKSDQTSSGKGFSASWNTGCGDVIRGTNGAVATPNFPDPVPQSVSCHWEIYAQRGHNVRLTFDKRSNLGHLKVMDGNDSEEKAITSLTSPWQSQSSFVKVKFGFDSSSSSSSSSDKSGFSATWESVCGYITTDTSGEIAFPSGQAGYLNNLNCTWDIDVSEGDKQRRVNITFKSIDVEADKSCRYDYVQIIDPDKDNFEENKFCGKMDSVVLTSLASRLNIHFISDNSKPGKGFNLMWETVDGCGGTFNTKQGHLMSPNHPNKYGSNQNCKWTIDPIHGIRINITIIDLALEAVPGGNGKCSDYVQVSNRTIGTETPKWCQQDSVIPVIGDRIEVLFSSDGEGEESGFYAQWAPAD